VSFDFRISNKGENDHLALRIIAAGMLLRGMGIVLHGAALLPRTAVTSPIIGPNCTVIAWPQSHRDINKLPRNATRQKLMKFI